MNTKTKSFQANYQNIALLRKKINTLISNLIVLEEKQKYLVIIDSISYSNYDCIFDISFIIGFKRYFISYEIEVGYRGNELMLVINKAREYID